MKLSIITINYNNHVGLENTIKSVKSQSCHEFEYIIVDGDSTDGSKDILFKYSMEMPIKYKSEKDRGIYNAMNKAVLMSSGDYCIFMNSGDIFHDKNSVKNALTYLDSDYDILSGIGVVGGKDWMPVHEDGLSLSFFLKDSMNHQGTFIKRVLLLEHPYREDLKISSDTEFFFYSLIIKSVRYMNIPVYINISEPPGASSQLDLSLGERYSAIQDYLPPRMSYDVEFLIKHHNPVIKGIGNIMYNKLLRRVFHFFKYVLK